MPYLFLTAAIIAEVIATSALKASDGFSQLIPSIIVVMGYGLAFWLLSLTLKSIPVGIAYATWSGAGIILITAIGWIVFGQKLDPVAIVGMVLIIAGVVLINLVSRSAAH